MNFGHFWNRVCTELVGRYGAGGISISRERVKILYESGCDVDEAKSIIATENLRGVDYDEIYDDEDGDRDY